MDKEILTYLAGLGGVGFGWILNESSQLIKNFREEKKVKRKVLYYLLELLHIVQQLNDSDIIKMLSEEIINTLPEKQRTNEQKTEIESFYRNHIGRLRDDITTSKIKSLESDYLSSINELALINPVLAYNLRGKNTILGFFNLLTDYFDSIKSENPSDLEDIEKASLEINKVLKPSIIQSNIKSIEKEILAISWDISLFTYFKTKKLINDSFYDLDSKRKEIKKLFNLFNTNN